MSEEKVDEALKDLLDPKKLLEQLRECETKQFKNAIDLLQECEERHRRNEKKLSRLTIAASAGGALVGQEAVQEVGTFVETFDQILTGDVSAVTEATGIDASSIGFNVDENGNLILPGGFFGGAGGAGGGAGNGVGANPEKATPTTEDEEDSTDEDEEKGKKDKEEEEEAEEEEEESEEEEEESEEEEEEEDEDEEEEDEEEEEKEQEEQQEEEQEQEQETPEPDPPSQDQSASIPSIPDNTEETNLLDYFEADFALTEMEAIETLIQDTPDLLENLPAILRSRKPDAGEVIVGDYNTNDPTPPVVVDEEVVEEVVETIEVPASPLDDPYTPPYIPPIAGVPIPEPGVLGLLIIGAWFCTGWSFRRRRD